MNAYREARPLEVQGMIACANLPDTEPEPSAWREITPGYRTKTITRGNVTIVIHRPILSDKERAKRERAVETALSNYAKSIYIEQGETRK
jgi:hypothetical protein